MIYGEETKKPTSHAYDLLLQDNIFHPMPWHHYPVVAIPPGVDRPLDAIRWKLGEIHYEHSTNETGDD
jgi:hypothetical protein